MAEVKPRCFISPHYTICKVSWPWLKYLSWFSGPWHTFERELGVALILLFPIKGQKRWRRVQLVQFHPGNSEAAPFTPPGLCPSPGGRPSLWKLGLATEKQTTTWLSISILFPLPSAGSSAGVRYLLLSSPWGIVMDIPGPTSLPGGVFWLLRFCELSALLAK